MSATRPDITCCETMRRMQEHPGCGPVFIWDVRGYWYLTSCDGGPVEDLAARVCPFCAQPLPTPVTTNGAAA